MSKLFNNTNTKSVSSELTVEFLSCLAKNNLSRAKEILQTESLDIKYINNIENNLLSYYYRDMDVVKFLVEYVINVDCMNQKKQSPLYKILIDTAILYPELKQEQVGGFLEVLNEVYAGNANDLYLGRLPVEVLDIIGKAMDTHFILMSNFYDQHN